MFKDLIIKNRSTRGYDRSRIVSEEEMLEMIDCARLSAASMNVQPLKFYMTANINEADIVTQNVKYAGALPELGLPYKGTEPPAYILICQDTRIHPGTGRFLKDVGIYAQSMSLCAVDMGLSCLMIGAYDPARIREVLGLPEYYDVLLVLAVGKGIEDIRLIDFEGPAAPTDLSDKAALDAYRKEDLARAQYYRDGDIHYTPKRKLEEVVIRK